MDSKAIRQLMRERRRALPPLQQDAASAGLAQQFSNISAFRNSNRIAFYLASDGEIDPQLAMGIAEAAGKECYLPVLHPLKLNRLYFVRYCQGDPLSINRFGIEEPHLQSRRIVPPLGLDLILLPLVAFDRHGNRLGMGGGFYDRTLATQQHLTRLIGLAHSWQETDSIQPQPWDVGLRTIVTESNVIHCPTNPERNTTYA
ncbi:MAG: 5-formyltetrahydrofolate cyclo-ligase [Porticoccus sp.]|jgi:5-formyltetrahydrofolate cyclo-ligase